MFSSWAEPLWGGFLVLAAWPVKKGNLLQSCTTCETSRIRSWARLLCITFNDLFTRICACSGAWLLKERSLHSCMLVALNYAEKYVFWRRQSLKWFLRGVLKVTESCIVHGIAHILHVVVCLCCRFNLLIHSWSETWHQGHVSSGW